MMKRRRKGKVKRKEPEFTTRRRDAELSYPRAPLPQFDIDDLSYLARQIFAKKELTPEKFEQWLATCFDQVAIIIGHTYAERGDGAELADDVALMMVRDLLLEVDAHIIERNKEKRLPRRRLKAIAGQSSGRLQA